MTLAVPECASALSALVSGMLVLGLVTSEGLELLQIRLGEMDGGSQGLAALAACAVVALM
jgi:hypothetical protein